jgi:photosystem II stability/assembly factor-like uncharacterized protein
MLSLFTIVAFACVASAAAAPVAQPEADGLWHVVAKDLLTTELCVAFESDTKGWVAGDANGVGPVILGTENGGKNWTKAEAKFGVDALLLACAAAEKTIVISSIFGELYSNDDGKSFRPAYGGGMSQSVRYFGKNGDGGHKFGCAGSYTNGKQGVSVSTNSGKAFTHFLAPDLVTDARYAAFPSDNVWYIAAGQFPSNTGRKTEFKHANGSYRLGDFGGADTAGYAAQIVKTEDGGKTWKSLFLENGTFYANGIDCINETHCCFAGEASDSSAPGARIYCTTDGTNFKRNFFAGGTSQQGWSLLDIRFADDKLGWAVGGSLNPIAPRAWFVETTDGGQTWDATKHELNGFYALGLDVRSPTLAYAAIDNLITQTSGVAKYTVVAEAEM